MGDGQLAQKLYMIIGNNRTQIIMDYNQNYHLTALGSEGN